MGRREEDTGFICVVCKRCVDRIERGSYRNHCPFCLSSVHVDEAVPGDRKSECRGIMQAHGLILHTKKGWQIVHKCMKCGVERPNRVAVEDNWDEVCRLSYFTGSVDVFS